MYQSIQMSGLRRGAVISIATTITFLLFFLMQLLIQNDQVELDHAERIPLPEFIRIFEKPVEIILPPESKPDHIDEPPPLPDLEERSIIDPDDGFTRLPHDPGFIGGHDQEILQPSFNSGLLVIVDMQPIYPQRAITKNIEGFVIVEFTVTEAGATNNIRVLEAMPENIFDKSAIRAASKSRYKPKIVDGKAVAVTGVKRKFSFELED